MMLETFRCLPRIPLLAFHDSGSSSNPLLMLDVIVFLFWLLSMPVLWICRAQTWSMQWVLFLCLEVFFSFATLYMLSSYTLPLALLLRSLPLLRVSYIATLWQVLASRHAQAWIQMRSLESHFVMNLVNSVLTGAWLLHVLTCAWFAVGKDPHGWVQDQKLQAHSATVQYGISFEWALARLPPSRLPDSMMLSTQKERGLAALATALALIFASVFTSRVTNDMSDIRRHRSMQQRSQNQASKFLRTYPVPWELERELKAYLQRNTSLIQPPRKEEMTSLLPTFLYRELCPPHDFCTEESLFVKP